ncbi:MAG TPA: hypothetical protein VKF84_10240 [Candidatus Sulfotelmatobacter sp.]|nr:hypothetical protein [Candidatus Sulfotelmatobacter sp.]
MTELFVVASRVVVSEIHIHSPSWRGLARMVGNFFYGFAWSCLHREPISVLVSKRVNIFASLDLLQR